MTSHLQLLQCHEGSKTYRIDLAEAERRGVPVIVTRTHTTVTKNLTLSGPPSAEQIKDAKRRRMLLEVRLARKRGVNGSCRIIMMKVALRTGHLFSEVTGRCREQDLVDARHRAFWGMRAGTDWSLSDIGRFFGRDHTTVLHGVRKHSHLVGKPVPGRRIRKA